MNYFFNILFVLFFLTACSQEKNISSIKDLNPTSNQLILDMNTDSMGLSNTMAIFHTTKGDFKIKFYSHFSPRTCQKIIGLLQNKYFDGGIIKRTYENYIVQFANSFQNLESINANDHLFEFNSLQHISGSVSLIHNDEGNTKENNAEFYVALTTLPHLDKKFTVFGQVTEGINVIESLKTSDLILNVEIK